MSLEIEFSERDLKNLEESTRFILAGRAKPVRRTVEDAPELGDEELVLKNLDD